MARASSEDVARASGDVIALYTAGVSMALIAERTGLSRTTVRQVLLAAGVPRRPTGRPRMALSSKAVADLYESGLTMPQVAKRLRIRPAFAWTRYVEIRHQRGLAPGRWHKLLLEALETAAIVVVVAVAADHVGRELTNAEGHAVRRAARELARVGVADTGHVTLVRNGRRSSYLTLARPGVDPNDAQPLIQADQSRRGDARSL